MINKIFNEEKFKINVLDTSSKGNCTIVNNMILDWGSGVAQKHLTQYLPHMRHIFISHEHSDHFHVNKIDHVLKKYPVINIFMNNSTFAKFERETKAAPIDYENRIILYDNNKIFKLKFRNEEYKIKAFEIPHLNTDGTNCMNFGLVIMHVESRATMMYVTDTHDLSHVKAPNDVDVLILEANYNMKIAKENDGLKRAADIWSNFDRVLLSHFEDKKAYQFAAEHLKDDGYMIEFHQSSENRIVNEDLKLTKAEIIERLKNE